MKSQLNLKDPENRKTLFLSMRTRFIEQALLSLVQSGKIRGTFHSSLGQESLGAAVSLFLNPSDAVFSHHRNHGHLLPLMTDIKPFLSELMSKEGALCDGNGGTQHLHIEDKFFSSGVQGSLLPVAAGWTFQKRTSIDAIGVAIIGDGTLGRGVVYETFNLIALKKIPMLVIVEDNGIAQSVEQKDSLAGSIELRAKAFGIDYHETNTRDWAHLISTLKNCFKNIRTEKKTVLVRIATARLAPHSRGDDLRSSEEIKRLWEDDLIEGLRLSKDATYLQFASELSELVQKEILEVQSRAPVRVPVRFEQDHKIKFSTTEIFRQDGHYIKAINQAFKNALKQSKNLVFVGEDILDPYGGAFKASKGLSTQFKDQMIQTPISEEAIAGFSQGIVLAGGACLTEFMFADFSLLGVEAITTTGEALRHLVTNLKGPVFRLPSGGGKGYGPTHSQSPERSFLGFDRLQVLSLSAFLNPEMIYSKALFENKASIVIEPKELYSSSSSLSLPEGFVLLSSDETYPTFWLRPESAETEVTLVAYGFGALKAFEALTEILSSCNLVPELFVLSRLSQLEDSGLAPYFSNKKVLLIDDGPKNFGVMAHLSAILNQAQARPDKIRLIGTRSSFIPAAQHLEDDVLVSVRRIVEECQLMK